MSDNGMVRARQKDIDWINAEVKRRNRAFAVRHTQASIIEELVQPRRATQEAKRTPTAGAARTRAS